MSSHHFVKEGQEPALLIIHAQRFAVVEPLLEWAPLVAVAHPELDTVLRWGIKVDVVFCPANEIQNTQEKIIDQEPVQIAAYVPNDNLLHEALGFLIHAKQSAVNLVANLTDEHFNLPQLFPKLTLVLLEHNIKWTFHSNHYSKWLPKNTELVIRKSEPNQSLSVGGFLLETNILKSSADGIVSMDSLQPFWIGEVSAE